MTDRMAALACLRRLWTVKGHLARESALAKFYTAAEGDALVRNKRFSVQAPANLDDVLERVVALVDHPDFTLKNPNRRRSLIAAFTMNAAPFRDESGKGYEFFGRYAGKAGWDQILRYSSRMAGSLIQWRR
jgi:aminopeptidase N